MNYSYLNNKPNKPQGIRINGEWLWISFLFLFALNFYDKASYLLICLLLISLVVIFFENTTFKFTIDLFLIILFAISYFIIRYNYQPAGMNSILVFLIGPIAFFIIGYFMTNTNNKLFERTLLAVAFGLFSHGFFNMMRYFLIYGFNSIEGARAISDIWTGISIAATMQGTYFSLISSLLFYGIFLNRQRAFIMSSTLIACILFSLISSFILGNRTMVFILLISFMVNFLIFILLNKLKINELAKVGSLIVIIFLIVFFVYINNIFGSKDFLLNSSWYERTESNSIMEDSRFLIFKVAISQMFDFPFGGYKMSFMYAHNLWLDVLHATGLIPFFFLLLYTLVSLKNLFGFINVSHISIEKKLFVVSVYLGFFLTFMVEPILEAVPFLFLMFILFNGMTKKYLDLNKQPMGVGNYTNTMAH